MSGPGALNGAPAVLLTEVELSTPLPAVGVAAAGAPAPAPRTRILVRLHGHPLGTIDLPLPADGLDPGALAAAIRAHLGIPIRQHLAADGIEDCDRLPAEGLGPGDEPPCSWRAAMRDHRLPPATIVINTCGTRDALLVRAVTSALAQSYPDFEVVVVDNRPATSRVAELLRSRFPGEDRLRCVEEPVPGLASGRNTGLRVARGERLAFTDDDVLLDPDWLAWLVAGFTVAERVACVTGLILPLELETPAQLLIEEFGGFGKGFTQRIWDLDEHRLTHPLYPYIVGIYGSGANAAFHRDALIELGGFDPHLGAGTPSRGGEDLDIYTTIVRRGLRLVYEPCALLRHTHFRELRDLRRQIRDYGVGLSAMLTKHLLQDADSRRAVLSRLPAGLVYALSPRSPKNSRKSPEYPRHLTLLEIGGLLWGPMAYLVSRRSS